MTIGLCRACGRKINDEYEVCSMCENSLGKAAFLRCDKCNRVWGVVDPGPLKFDVVLETGKTYDTEGCCFCSEEECGSFKVVAVRKAEEELLKNKIRWMVPVNEYGNAFLYLWLKNKVENYASYIPVANRNKLIKLTDFLTHAYWGKPVAKYEDKEIYFRVSKSKNTKQRKVHFIRLGNYEADN